MAGVSESTVRRWLKLEILDKCQPGGPRTRVLIPADALEKFQQNDSQTAASKHAAQPQPNQLPGKSPDWMSEHNT